MSARTQAVENERLSSKRAPSNGLLQALLMERAFAQSARTEESDWEATRLENCQAAKKNENLGRNFRFGSLVQL